MSVPVENMRSNKTNEHSGAVIDGVISLRHLVFVHMSVTDQLINTPQHVHNQFVFLPVTSLIKICSLIL